MPIVNIITENDADFNYAFVYSVAADPLVVGSVAIPIDLTGATMTMKCRKDASNVTVDLTLSSGDDGSIIITNGPLGLFSIMIAQAKLEALAPGVYAQSLIMTTGGIKRRIWNGTLTNNPGPSR